MPLFPAKELSVGLEAFCWRENVPVLVVVRRDGYEKKRVLLVSDFSDAPAIRFSHTCLTAFPQSESG